jgi:hypothetical protein
MNQAFVLLYQSHGVCTPYTVSADCLYYLSHFRNDTTAKHNRKATWNRLIRKSALKPGTKVLTAE